MNFRTRSVHAGQRPEPGTGAHATPIYQTSTFAYGSFERGARLFAGDEAGFVYSRISNPTVRAFEEKLADLENAGDALGFASGMAAVAALCLTLLRTGDNIACLGPLYGGTEGFFLDTLARFGVSVQFFTSLQELEREIAPNTRMLYVETPTNPTLCVHDLAQVARIAKNLGVLSVTDNTFATPYLTRPLELGFDVVLHSATKYLSGHGDVIGGVLAGSVELIQEVRSEGLRHVGGALAPLNAFLLLRGMKTLPLRMDAHCSGANMLAQELVGHPGIVTVHYPGLTSHPNHTVARAQMHQFGGLVSLELRGGEAMAKIFLDALKLFTQAVSLGDVESLASHPASTTHQLLGELRAEQGITPGLVRLSIGIEDPEDLLADINQALEHALQKAGSRAHAD